MKRISLIFLLLFPVLIFAQDPQRFEEEIVKFKHNKNTYDVVFTGSSSIRFWKTLRSDFPDVNLVNTGFGGSHMSDLDFYLEDLVLKYQPQKVFIYEGDNDVSSGKSQDEIIDHTQKVIDQIFDRYQDVKIYLISAKPSPSRFHLKEKYEALNSRFKSLAADNSLIEYVDVWNPMLDQSGNPIADIFIEDELNMNARGYDIWEKVIGPFLN